ncbi:MAG: TIGR02147 family protein [Deltaproteobacteria bacterium]|nr:TIGR02147 family protein [Deltaproteobacteria bacterium]MBI2500838.1 TIGR02147 family protein [Deltaproteobacteria bacterium]
MPDIFNYLNYRHYLKDYYSEKKGKKGSHFSFRSFSRLAGLSSPNFLKLVIEGKRNLGGDGIQSFIKGLRLNKEESVFFEDLVHFNQATTDEERNQHYQRLSRSRRYRQVKQIEKDYFVYFSRWYYAAIRELVLLPEFKEDPIWIASKLAPAITPNEARVAIELLLELGFIKRDKNGKLTQSERNITTEREVASLAIKNFHRQMIEKAAESIEKTSHEKRDISSLTVALSKEKFEETKRRIQEFRRELNVLLSEEGKADSVYQINFQIFNLTEVRW